MHETVPGGSFIIARKLFLSPIWLKDPIYLKVWLWIIGHASYEKREMREIECERGQFITTYDEIIKAASHYHNRAQTLPSLKKIRVIIGWFESQVMIRTEAVKKPNFPTGADTRAETRAYLGIKISVLNYYTYQNPEVYKGRHKGRPSVPQGQINNNKENNVRSRFVQSSIELELAAFLLKQIRKNKPDFKEPNLKAWAKEFELMIRRDKRDPDRIREVISWVQDDPFWFKNILSAAKLRKQFDRIEMEMSGKPKSPQPPPLGSGAGTKAKDSAAPGQRREAESEAIPCPANLRPDFAEE